jgi:4-hydroxy-4-methyl-2-oxoglutarate aldolase
VSQKQSTHRNADYVDRADRLYTAVISDILDQLGYRDQVMDPRIRPLFPAARVIGFAKTVHVVPVPGVPERQEDYYQGEIAALEQLERDDVMVVSTIENCFWGELLSTAAQYRGARGVVLDCYTRDTQGITAMGFPVFAAGIHVADALGRVDVDQTGETIEAGGIPVRPGDMIMGDFDGVVVIPSEVTDEVIRRAEEKVSGENIVRRKLEEGMPLSEAFRRYGIL